MLHIANTALLLLLIWITAHYSARGFELPLLWWLIAAVILGIQAFSWHKSKNDRP